MQVYRKIVKNMSILYRITNKTPNEIVKLTRKEKLQMFMLYHLVIVITSMHWYFWIDFERSHSGSTKLLSVL